MHPNPHREDWTEPNSPDSTDVYRRCQEVDELLAEQGSRKTQVKWLRQPGLNCGRCGGEMAPLHYQSVRMARCGQCNGLFLEGRDAAALLRAKDPYGLLVGVIETEAFDNEGSIEHLRASY